MRVRMTEKHRSFVRFDKYTRVHVTTKGNPFGPDSADCMFRILNKSAKVVLLSRAL